MHESFRIMYTNGDAFGVQKLNCPVLRSIFATEFEITDTSSFHYGYRSRGDMRALQLLMFTY